MLRGDRDFPESIIGVQGCKEFGFYKRLHTLVRSRQGIWLLELHSVLFSIVNTES